MGLKFYLFILFIFNTSFLLAQDSIPEIQYDAETEYIHMFPNRITVRMFYVNTDNELTVKDRNSDLYYNLVPNKQENIGASVAFRSISISYSIAPNFLAENKDNDDSKLFNLGLRTYFGKHWMQSLELYSAKGFYVSDADFDFYFPNIKSFKIGGATSFIMNENFSFRAIVTQDEKQLKSVGSFIPRIFYYYSKFSITDDNIDSDNYSYDIALAPAYYYNFVPTKNLFFSAGVSAGLGVNYSKSDEESLTSLLTELNFRGSATYDINDFYLGAHYNYLILNHNSDSSSYIKDGIPYLQFFLGYRFKAPQKLVRKADKINEKLKLKS